MEAELMADTASLGKAAGGLTGNGQSAAGGTRARHWLQDWFCFANIE